jgi:hypothetical protein
MLKNKIKPGKPVQVRNSKKRNDGTAPVNIFKLIDSIPKIVKSKFPFSKYAVNTKYAEALLLFCETKITEKLNALNFKKSDTLGEFIYFLTDLILKNGFTIVYDLETFEDTGVIDFNFEFKNTKYNWHWYIMEAKSLIDISSTELQTGYAHVLKNFGNRTETSFVDHDYSSLENSMYSEEAYYIESGFDDGCFDTECLTFEEYEIEILKPYKLLKEQYDEAVSRPLEQFYSYIPKNDKEKELKDLISYGLTIDFSIIHRFPDDENPFGEDEELIMYSDSFMLLCEYVSDLDQQLMEFRNDRANNCGVTNPTNYYRHIDGEIQDGPSEKEEKELTDLCEFLCNISNYFD